MRDLHGAAGGACQGEIESFHLSGHNKCKPATPLLTQLPCGHKFCKKCIEEYEKKGVDKSCPLCRNPLPPGPEKLFDLGFDVYMKIVSAVDRNRPGVNISDPWPTLSGDQKREMDQAVAMLREAADQGHMDAQTVIGVWR